MSTPTPLAVSVSRVIAADPVALYDLVADVTAMPQHSPETTKVTWLGGATTAAVGVRFKGHNRVGRARWSTKPTVTAADRGRTFAFQVPGGAGALWTYDFEPVDGGTRVTESMIQQKASPAPIRFLLRRNGITDRAAHLRAGMATTLDRLADHATAGRPTASDISGRAPASA